MAEEQQGNKLNIELDEQTAEGTYANLAIITHSVSEFVMDYVRVMPGVPKAKVKSRVVLTPFHAKRLLHALNDNIQKYESIHGPIKEAGADPQVQGIPMNYGGTMGEA